MLIDSLFIRLLYSAVAETEILATTLAADAVARFDENDGDTERVTPAYEDVIKKHSGRVEDYIAWPSAMIMNVGHGLPARRGNRYNYTYECRRLVECR
ncbi:MAG: hypothetical protein ABSG53_25435 [Thermoguttaceae bacterium]|jgi:hypothetical protein